MAAGGIISAVSAYSQGVSAKRLGEFNAKLSEREAQEARDGAAIEEDRHRDELRRFQGSQRAAGGASGLSLINGPTGLLVEEAAVEGERDALLIRYAGDIKAAKSLSEAAAERFKGKAAYRQGVAGAASSLLKAGAYGYKAYKAS